jgi:hypothetical protein
LGIETRRNGNFYYYRKVRRNGRVVSEYVAGGEIGALYAQMARLGQERAALERLDRRNQREAEQAQEREARDLARQCQELAELALLAAGYHRHNGTWRKRRNTMIAGSRDRLNATLQEQAKAELARREAQKRNAELPPLPESGDYTPEARRAILKRADRVDATAEDMAALRAMFKAHGRDVASDAGILRQALERELREMNATGLGRELITIDLDKRRAALGYDTAPALEKPLIDHVLLCELRLGLIEQSYTNKWGGSMSLEQGRFWEGRLSAAQRRYLQAVEALARVRRVRVELMKIAPDGSAEAVAVERPGA